MEAQMPSSDASSTNVLQVHWLVTSLYNVYTIIVIFQSFQLQWKFGNSLLAEPLGNLKAYLYRATELAYCSEIGPYFT